MKRKRKEEIFDSSLEVSKRQKYHKSLNDIPIDNLKDILSFLPFGDYLITCPQVCRLWCDIVGETRFLPFTSPIVFAEHLSQLMKERLFITRDEKMVLLWSIDRQRVIRVLLSVYDNEKIMRILDVKCDSKGYIFYHVETKKGYEIWKSKGIDKPIIPIVRDTTKFLFEVKDGYVIYLKNDIIYRIYGPRAKEILHHFKNKSDKYSQFYRFSNGQSECFITYGLDSGQVRVVTIDSKWKYRALIKHKRYLSCDPTCNIPLATKIGNEWYIVFIVCRKYIVVKNNKKFIIEKVPAISGVVYEDKLYVNTSNSIMLYTMGTRGLTFQKSVNMTYLSDAKLHLIRMDKMGTLMLVNSNCAKILDMSTFEMKCQRQLEGNEMYCGSCDHIAIFVAKTKCIMWNTMTCKESFITSNKDNFKKIVKFEGTKFAVCSFDKAVIYDFNKYSSLEKQFTIQYDSHLPSTLSLPFPCGTSTSIISCDNQTIQINNYETGELMRRIKLNPLSLKDIKVSKCGRFCFLSCSNGLYIIDLKSEKLNFIKNNVTSFEKCVITKKYFVLYCETTSTLFQYNIEKRKSIATYINHKIKQISAIDDAKLLIQYVVKAFKVKPFAWDIYDLDYAKSRPRAALGYAATFNPALSVVTILSNVIPIKLARWDILGNRINTYTCKQICSPNVSIHETDNHILIQDFDLNVWVYCDFEKKYSAIIRQSAIDTKLFCIDQNLVFVNSKDEITLYKGHKFLLKMRVPVLGQTISMEHVKVKNDDLIIFLDSFGFIITIDIKNKRVLNKLSLNV